MTRLLMLVEGQSEETFVRDTVAPYLAEFGVYVECTVLKSKRLAAGSAFRGGVSSWKKIQTDLRILLGDTDAWVTTMFDFYGLPDDFPGYRDALGRGRAHDQVESVEQRFATEMGNRRFIPFLVLHEFEAWIFSEPEVVAVHFGVREVAMRLQEIVNACGEPELIDHGVTSHPKARLMSMGLSYKAASDGPRLLDKIGIDAIGAACPHFAAWFERLKRLGEDL